MYKYMWYMNNLRALFGTTALADSGDGRSGSESFAGPGSREECREQREQPLLLAELLEPARLVAHVPA